ncbi:hypothetical protein AB0F17_02015 [Nonomuraea sp. NPDC026600]|uniref:hypothetical protein n=1 Tax=Nonomuraea sp. NPDC026600 TaxID=3155363 RepID=UPI0034028285
MRAASATRRRDERVQNGAHLLLFGLDHAITGQEPASEEIEALRQFLAWEGTCLILGPHHDVGASDDLAVRDAEYHHHGDAWSRCRGSSSRAAANTASCRD